MNTRLGYCCISLGEYCSSFKTTTLTNAKKSKDEARKKLENIWKHNLQELVAVLNYNRSLGIPLYRISSNMFPLADHEDYVGYWKTFCEDSKNFKEAKKSVSQFITAGGRLGAHPSQFVSIGSEDKKTRKNSAVNLEFHSTVFDLLGLPRTREASINIHLSSGKKGAENVPYFVNSLDNLSEGVRARLVFETEDKGFWTWQQIAKYFPAYSITLDFHHWKINNQGEPLQEAFDACVDSWFGERPLMHISEGKSKPMDRAHHDWVSTLPEQVLNHPVDLEIEAKKKDLAVLTLVQKYKDYVYTLPA
jgi:UV DNA damage endonuclease